VPLLLETIKIEDGEVHNLSYHQERFEKSRKELFGVEDNMALSSIIEAPPKGLYRCRILYHKTIHTIDYIPYLPKEIHRLKIVSSNISYGYKYADRTSLNDLLEKEENCDEVIIEKEGLLTDTTIANIAFYDGEQWVTPAKPLLEGTMRAKLLDEGYLCKKEIKRDDLKAFRRVALMNSMIGFKILNHFNIEA
jgi:4-amino-4-deoxychorismate lyase